MYRALYRKWRPQTFTDVSGQEHITNTLMHEVEAGRLSHAYLFTGSRGTGKTSCAKILSKAVNCLHPVNGNPCNECEICRGIDDGSILDVTEIDAASNNGVDNIRDLREEANFTPAAAKYRVYIIDEVHMLSAGAFNALLKTLEEPPEHVLFILATTEVQKLPATILSRCQRFDFRRIPAEDISARLLKVAENENLELSEDASLLIARIADGALRDALSILDQCAGANEPITVNTVSNCAGLLGKDYLFEISDAVINNNASRVLSIIDRLHSSSCDMERLISELVNHFRNVMMAKTAEKPEEFIVCTPDELSKYMSLAKKMTYGTVLYVMETLCKEASALKYSSHQRAQVETVLIRLCTPELSTDNSAIIRRIDELESQLKSLKANGITVSHVSEIPTETHEYVSENKNSISQIGVPEENTSYNEDKIEISENSNSGQLSSDTALQSNLETKNNTEEKSDKPFNNEVSKPIEERNEKPVDYGVVSENDKALPFTAWESVLKQISIINKPLYPFLIGSQAFRAGNTVFIKAKNTSFADMFTQKFNVDSVTEALARATGEKLRPVIYNEGNSPAAEETAEPIDALITKLNKLKIDYIIDE